MVSRMDYRFQRGLSTFRPDRGLLVDLFQPKYREQLRPRTVYSVETGWERFHDFDVDIQIQNAQAGDRN